MLRLIRSLVSPCKFLTLKNARSCSPLTRVRRHLILSRTEILVNNLNAAHSTPIAKDNSMDFILRFLIGGMVVSFFSILGDVLKPKSFGGVFAGAPTIALATIALTAHKHGVLYTALEGRSMIAGAIAFFAYACAVSFILMRFKSSAAKTAAYALPIWCAVAFSLWAVWLRS